MCMWFSNELWFMIRGLKAPINIYEVMSHNLCERFNVTDFKCIVVGLTWLLDRGWTQSLSKVIQDEKQ